MSSTRTLFSAVAAAAIAVLTGCATPEYEHAAGTGVIPTEQFPLQTEAAPEGILLAPHDFGLSDRQRAAVGDLAERWKAHRDGMVLIEAPASGGRDAAATAYAARAFLEENGVPADSIDLISYQDAGGAEPPVRISHLGLQAKIPECGRSWDDLTRTGRNQPTQNFGCAVNANLAAMIDDPADIDRPRALDPVDAGRRQSVLEKYRRGAVTSSERDPQANATLSQSIR